MALICRFVRWKVERNMKTVGITGISGLIGRHLAKELHRRGTKVLGYSRSARSLEVADEVRSFENPDFRGLDALIHLAGEPIMGRWTSAKKERIRSSRVEGTRALVQAMAALSEADRPRTFVCASAIGFYGERGDEILTESSPPGSGFLADVARRWEEEARRAEAFGVRVVMGRTGVALAAEGGAAPLWKAIFGAGLGGKLGSGSQWVSWVEIGDLVAMLAETLEWPDLRGPVNLVSPNPVRNEELTRVLGRVSQRPAILPAPAFALRLMLGGVAEMLLQSQRVEPAVFRSRGFAWKEPELEGALKSVFFGG